MLDTLGRQKEVRGSNIMKWKFCAECGKKLEQDWNNCPGCGVLVGMIMAYYYPLVSWFPIYPCPCTGAAISGDPVIGTGITWNNTSVPPSLS